MKGYVIYQTEKNIEGYYIGDYYIVHSEKFGWFNRDIKLAKIYKSKKIAENAMKSLWKFANVSPNKCKVLEIEVLE